MKFQPVIKWSGSKRSQSEEIIKRFPKNIKTYYEPFVGGASVLFQLINSDIIVEKYVCSDINSDLINLWNTIKNSPNELYKHYSLLWNELNSIENIDKRKEYYYDIRKRFNEIRNPMDFMFLSRTCVNGLIRFNSKGEFNTSLHFSRPGINPCKLKKIIYDWSNLLNKNNVIFMCRDYKNVESKEGDFIYLDPPYANTTGMYYGVIDYNELWDWMRNQKCDYMLSFDGKTSSIDITYEVPKDIYSKHEYLYSGNSSFRRVTGNSNSEYVSESLYIKSKSDE